MMEVPAVLGDSLPGGTVPGGYSAAASFNAGFLAPSYRGAEPGVRILEQEPSARTRPRRRFPQPLPEGICAACGLDDAGGLVGVVDNMAGGAYTFNFFGVPENQTTDASGGGQDEQR